ncbi:MAG: MoaD/ThiS family protein [Rhodocyclaceae bacterium]|jgi:molybdopterin converting factor small subunit|nr:MoaD/ThiS family protein [Rhodocyclaceae bacterium]
MNDTMTLSIRMFGAFRKYHQGELTLDLPVGSTASTVKSAIAATLQQSNPAFGNSDLIEKSVLADNHRILPDDAKISSAVTLAILPPVCGG